MEYPRQLVAVQETKSICFRRAVRCVPLGRGVLRSTPEAESGGRRPEILQEEDVRRAFCLKEFNTKGTCDFQNRFLFIAIFGARSNAVSTNA